MKNLVFILLIILASCTNDKDVLKTCWERQTQPLQKEYFIFSFAENANILQHSFEPWEETNYKIHGEGYSNHSSFGKRDTLISNSKKYSSITQVSSNTLLFKDYGAKELSSVTIKELANSKIETAKYIPSFIIQCFTDNVDSLKISSDKEMSVYEMSIGENIVTLFINNSTCLLNKMTVLNDHELFGDVLTTYHFNNYSKLNLLSYPKKITVDKINGKITDEVEVLAASLVDTFKSFLEKPKDYKIEKEKEVKAEVEISKYNENIHFVELKHTDDKIMIVEFKEFLFVAEAPLNSENGELIIKKAKEIAPNKPIRYFAFGHYHAHYIGGVRAFVHKGANIISTADDEEYLRYIVSAERKINPDSLEMEPQSLKIQNIKDSLLISDETYQIKIYFIGEKSNHTKDYLIYYFPKEQLLFEDDLVWISKEGPLKKAGERQSGLYSAIEDLGLDVNTIIQSWPVSDYGVKTVISYSELEKSVKMK